MDAAFERLISGVEGLGPRQQVSDLLTAIAHARVAFHSALESVASWFRLPQDPYSKSFTLETAVHVALKQVTNCYTSTPVNSFLDLRVSRPLRGATLEGVVHILFILLQNAVRYSRSSGNPVKVWIAAADDHETFELKVRNGVYGDDLNDVQVQIEAANYDYRHADHMALVPLEGGTGLSKIWRILRVDLQTEHELSIQMGEHPTVEVVVRCPIESLAD
jgi:hypothetical protein